MYRNIIDEIAAWYSGTENKVLYLKGAKGVGKTWIVKDFASAFFKDVIVVDFEKEDALRDLFEGDLVSERIEIRLSAYYGKRIEPGSTLLVFDEIQYLEEPISKIMEFANNRKSYAFCMIASYTGDLEPGVDMSRVTELTMYPMSFEEFLMARKEQALIKQVEEEKISVLPLEAKRKVLSYLKEYFMIGGMPQIVMDYRKYRDVDRVRKLQEQYVEQARRIIVRTNTKANARKILLVYDSIPAQLAKENHKFMYGYVDEKARSREYEGAVEWLCDHGYVRKIYRIREGLAPLDKKVDYKSFVLYGLDHGLLGAMAGIPMAQYTKEKQMFDLMEGALVEQMVYAELTLNPSVDALYFWISGATAKVDFVYEKDGEVIPADVQARINTKAQSLKVFKQRYESRMIMRISLEQMSFQKGVLNVPIYGLWNF